ncbi:MAG: hypothetical protein V7727_18690 [Sneathiella sp.]
MTSKTQGFVEVEIFDKKYFLKYGYAAVDAIETKYDMQAGAAVAKVDEALVHFKYFLRLGLGAKYSETEIDDVIALEPLIVPVSIKIAEALSVAYVGPIESAAPVKKKRAPKKK